MSFESHKEQLLASTKDLMCEWRNVRQGWNDKKADDFERRFINVIDSQVNHTFKAIDTIAQMYNEARRDCSKDEG